MLKLREKLMIINLINIEKIIEIVPADNLIILSGGYKVMLSDKYKDWNV